MQSTGYVKCAHHRQRWNLGFRTSPGFPALATISEHLARRRARTQPISRTGPRNPAISAAAPRKTMPGEVSGHTPPHAGHANSRPTTLNCHQSPRRPQDLARESDESPPASIRAFLFQGSSPHLLISPSQIYPSSWPFGSLACQLSPQRDAEHLPSPVNCSNLMAFSLGSLRPKALVARPADASSSSRPPGCFNRGFINAPKAPIG